MSFIMSYYFFVMCVKYTFFLFSVFVFCIFVLFLYYFSIISHNLIPLAQKALAYKGLFAASTI